MGPKPRKGISPFLPFLLFFLFLFPPPVTSINEPEPTKDLEPLLALKSSIDPSNHLPWSRSSSSNLCTSWKGIKECTPRGRVTKLILEFLNLTGPLSSQFLAPLDQLRVLSFKSNSLSGALPDLTPLVNLKTLYLNDNHFTGRIPASLSSLHRLKILVLSENQLSGAIPGSLTSLPRLYTLYLQNNRLSGKIPNFNQPSLQYLNFSDNDLSGEIPKTQTLSQFNISSFSNNPSLCGPQIGLPCSKNPIFPPWVSPEPGVSSPILTSPLPPTTSKRSKTKRVVKIVAVSIAGVIFLAICLGLLLLLTKKRKRKTQQTASRSANIATRATDKATGDGEERGNEAGDKNGGGFSWEGEGLGRLAFCGGVGEMYSLEELLKASAETLGRGTVGSTYKAVMESGFIVTVKRLKDSGSPGAEEFRRRMEEIGRLRHPNLVPLRAYFQAREERLLVYDYFPNGSLFSLIHGSRPSGSGKPLHWTSCLKIAEDVATGLLYLHQAPAVHGNLKSSNVLLGSDFESCLTDYCLIPSLLLSNPESTSTSATALFYRAPECRIPKPFFTPASDIYSFGVLLLELLTGKTPFQDLVEEHGADIPQWVRSVREEETESGGDDPSSGNETAMPAASAEEKVSALLNIAMACVATEAERRPAMKDVVRMIREARAEVVVVVSSNSSGHSPGRWSDTVQSLPREYGSESFAERD